MHSHPSFKPGQLVVALAIGLVFVLGSLVHSAWAAPGQQPDRQSVPTAAPSPTPTSKKQDEKPAATATPAPDLTPTPAPLMPESGGAIEGPQSASARAALSPRGTALVLLAGGLALLVLGLWFATQSRPWVRRGPGAAHER
jgi:hypothetical protein